MASSLKGLLGSKNLTTEEVNLEKGRIYSYHNAAMYAKYCECVKFCAPANGTVILEIWGAGGSGAEMCCCGGGIPGNSGAYAKKTFQIAQGCMICGCIGKSCNNADDLCFRGCSEPTQVCYRTSTPGCLCAQGGKGGINMCTTGSSLYCCFRAQNICATAYGGANCGIVCNWCANGGGWYAVAYGGDVNCNSIIGCTSFLACRAQCICQFKYHIPLPAGMFSVEGGHATYGSDHDNAYSQWSGMGVHAGIAAINAVSRNPSRSIWGTDCWRSSNSCGCYNMQGCGQRYPYGAGGHSGVPCPGVRDHGQRGGDGLVRIKFIE